MDTCVLLENHLAEGSWCFVCRSPERMPWHSPERTGSTTWRLQPRTATTSMKSSWSWCKLSGRSLFQEEHILNISHVTAPLGAKNSSSSTDGFRRWRVLLLKVITQGNRKGGAVPVSSSKQRYHGHQIPQRERERGREGGRGRERD